MPSPRINRLPVIGKIQEQRRLLSHLYKINSVIDRTIYIFYSRVIFIDITNRRITITNNIIRTNLRYHGIHRKPKTFRNMICVTPVPNAIKLSHRPSFTALFYNSPHTSALGLAFWSSCAPGVPPRCSAPLAEPTARAGRPHRPA